VCRDKRKKSLKIKPARVEGGIAYIPLSRGYEAMIDVEDLPLVEDYNWCAQVYPTVVYAMRKDYSTKPAKTIKMHRVINKTPCDLHTDHENGNGLDNRKDNLRNATLTENLLNRGPRKESKSGLKGVTWSDTAQKWQARIASDGEEKHLGYFTNKFIAHRIYCEQAVLLHKEFARTDSF
jgi:hypothetical protein